MKERSRFCILFGCLIVCSSGVNFAATISIDEIRNLDARFVTVDGQRQLDRRIHRGDQFDVIVAIEGPLVENALANRARERLGAYDFDLSYDPNILAIQSEPTTTRGLRGPAYQSIFSLDNSEPGVSRVQMVSLHEFPVSTITSNFQFEAINTGTSPLDISVHSAVNLSGELRNLQVRSGEVKVVPIPAAVWLLGSALTGLIAFRRRVSDR